MAGQCGSSTSCFQHLLLVVASYVLIDVPTARVQLAAIGSKRCWAWIDGTFDLELAVLRLADGMHVQTAWSDWLTGNNVGLLNQVVAHALCRIPVARKAMVPHSEVRWQDLEQDGVVSMLSRDDL